MLLRDGARACWEATASMAVDFPDAWAALLVADFCGRGGYHDHRQNASYALVNYTVVFFRFWPTDYLARNMLTDTVIATYISQTGV